MSTPVRGAMQSLTTRGRAFLAGGLTAFVSGFLLGERDLVMIGVLVVILPVLTMAFVGRSGHQLVLHRTMTPHRVEAGRPAEVELHLTNPGSTTGVLMLEDQAPWEVGARPRFVVSGMERARHRRITYEVRPELRGKYDIGPMRARMGDPFGLAEVTRTFSGSIPLVVTPRVTALPEIGLGGTWTGSGDERPRAFATGSAADVTVREYRRGDDVRRVHWRSSARVGELMVRREEQPWQSRATLFLDNRRGSHRGEGLGSSLEAAVSAAASIAVHLSARGYLLRLVTADGEEASLGWHEGGRSLDPGPALERLAVVPAIAGHALSADWIDDPGSSGLVVALLGSINDHDRAVFGRIRHGAHDTLALALDVDSWSTRSTPSGSGEGAAPWLRARGWKAVPLEQGTSLAQRWQELGR